MEIPKSNQAVMPYLMLNSAETFAEFVLDVFDAELLSTQMQDDGMKIRHAEVNISGSTIMFCDTIDGWQPTPANMFIYVDHADESYHRALAKGATSVMELSDQTYGRTCGVTDPCGNVWWITSVPKKD